MIKILVTGDNHFGKKYDRYPSSRDKIIQSRFVALENMVKQAEQEECDLFVITGDLFDNNSISISVVRRVVRTLALFSGRVLVLPGNHDYYSSERKVWVDFQKELDVLDHNIILMKELRSFSFDVREERVTIYPALCQTKHSENNNLGWITEKFNESEGYHIGIAHGALEGITPDMDGQYFPMTISELNSIPVDVWLIGHTHIPYPKLPTDKEEVGHKIFNAGTHEQTDRTNNTLGYAFILRLDKSRGKTEIAARSFVSGRIRYHNLTVQLKPAEELEQAILNALQVVGKDSIVRLIVSGSVSKEDYEYRINIYDRTLHEFIDYEVDDENLSVLITPEMISSEFAEISFVSELLNELIEDDPKTAQMAYELIKKHQSKEVG